MEFLENNWISVVIIAGIIFLCVVACIIIKNVVNRYVLGMFITIVVSIGLIIGVYFLGMGQNDGNFEKLKYNFPIIRVNFPKTGTWIVTGNDNGVNRTANMVVNKTERSNFYGYFEWSDGANFYGEMMVPGGIENFHGYYYDDGSVIITGTSFENDHGIELGRYEFILSENKKDLIDGKTPSGGIYEAILQK